MAPEQDSKVSVWNVIRHDVAPEPGDQIPHLTPPRQGETQHRVRLEPVHVSPQFLIGHPNLVGFAD